MSESGHHNQEVRGRMGMTPEAAGGAEAGEGKRMLAAEKKGEPGGSPFFSFGRIYRTGSSLV